MGNEQNHGPVDPPEQREKETAQSADKAIAILSDLHIIRLTHMVQRRVPRVYQFIQAIQQGNNNGHRPHDHTGDQSQNPYDKNGKNTPQDQTDNDN